MKITLKKIEYCERLSEETNAFVADLYINSKKVGYCKNDGQGSCTHYYHSSNDDYKIIVDAEEYFKSLPKVTPDGYTFEYQPTLESAINDQFGLWLKKHEEKKMQKLMENAIIWGKPNAGSYTFVKQKHKLSQFPTNALQDFVDKLKAKHCTDGNVILNTNLGILGINI